MATTFVIYSSPEAATAVKSVGETVITARWNANKEKGTQAKSASIVLGVESLGMPAETPTQYRELIAKAISDTAGNQLKLYVDELPHASTVPPEYFSQTALIEAFLGAGLWIEKDRLEILFTASHTWQERVKSPRWENKQYQAVCLAAKEAYISVSGRKTRMGEDKAQMLLAKMDERDLDTEFGIFVARRLTQLMKANSAVDFEAF